MEFTNVLNRRWFGRPRWLAELGPGWIETVGQHTHGGDTMLS